MRKTERADNIVTGETGSLVGKKAQTNWQRYMIKWVRERALGYTQDEGAR